MRLTVDYDIVDFHCHPFTEQKQNICGYTEGPKDADDYLRIMEYTGIKRFAGSVISRFGEDFTFDDIHKLNTDALDLWKKYGDKFIPGVHIHPKFVRESCDELEAMSKAGVKLVGELVPYMMGWSTYASDEAVEIFGVAGELGMVVSLHSMNDDDMDALLPKIPNTTVVFAHPGEKSLYMRHLERMEKNPNAYLDLSGTGLFRYAMLAHGVNRLGAQRFLFGTDFPTCAPAMALYGVLGEEQVSDADCKLILRDNALRLLGLQ